MRFDIRLRVAAATTWLPTTRDYTADAVAAGIITKSEGDLKGVHSVPASARISAPDMAVKAGKLAMSRAGTRIEDVCCMVHSWLYQQGHELWSAPHYIANQLGLKDATPLGIHQGCDGGVLALQLAAMFLDRQDKPADAIVTTGDRFNMPGVDRWTTMPPFALGDSGTAVVLTTRPISKRGLRLVTICTETDPMFEVMNRGHGVFADYPLGNGMPIRTEYDYDSQVGMPLVEAVEISRKHVRAAFDRAISEAGIVDLNRSLQLIALPRVGTTILESVYMPVFEHLTDVDIVKWDEKTGHLGSGDCAADTTHLIEYDDLDDGRYAALIGAGGGFTWTCTLLQKVAV